MSNPSDFVIENGVLKKYVGPGGDVVIPEGVKKIGSRAFENCRNLKSVIIPDGVTSIGISAFFLCSGLKSITVPGSVTSIGYRAFDGCSSLKRAAIPEGVTSIGYNTFCGCRSLTSITIPGSVTSIGNNAFDWCKSLTGVTIPGSVKIIEEEAFANCTGLKDVCIMEGVTSIGPGAFHNCIGLKSLSIPDSVVMLSDGIVSDCKGLEYLSVTEDQLLSKSPLFSLTRREKREFAISHVYKVGGNLSFMLHVRRGQEEFRLGFANKADENDLKGYGAPGFWEKYDRELLNSGVNFRFKAPVCLLAALERLMKPDDLTESDRRAYADHLAKNVRKLIPLLEQSHRPDGIRALFSLGVVGETNEKAVRKLIAASADPEVASIAKEDLGSITVKQEETQEKELSRVEAAFEKIKNASGQTDSATDRSIKDFYGLSTDYLPFLLDQDGNQVSKSVFAWLLTAHEKIGKNGEVTASYEKPGLKPDAAKLTALLDQKRLQSALMTITDGSLGSRSQTKRHSLAYPICRYADEATMQDLTKRAASWRSGRSGNDAPALFHFRKAARFSDTRAAMLFAERCGELEAYAKLRGTDADTIRDKYLSEVGLDEKGGKSYDLGGRTVTARLQKDLSFLFELPNGKTAKSLPKKGAAPEKYEAAKADFDEMHKSVKKIVKSRSDVLFGDFLSGRERNDADWREAYLKNPLLRAVAELLVWAQGEKTFTLGENGPVDSAGKPYEVKSTPIRLAHPMEMRAADLTAWQKYFTAHGLKQPFAQIWEPVIDPAAIRADRYEGSVQPMYRFSGKDRHGIHSGNLHAYSEDVGFSLDGCELDYEASVWRIQYEGAEGETYTLGKFRFGSYTRQVNHIVSLLDKWTAEDRVKKDDVSVMDLMGGFTLAQITEFVKSAQEAGAVNVLALLLEYKNARFADFDPMDEFTLEW